MRDVAYEKRRDRDGDGDAEREEQVYNIYTVSVCVSRAQIFNYRVTRARRCLR